ELARIADALDSYSGQVAADCVRLIMATGARPIEAKTATWEQFDREPGFWVKPSSHTKQKKEHRVPLSPPALALIERLLKERAGGSVFPGRVDGHLDATQHCWRYVRQHAGLPEDARLYDLRHTFASLGAGGGLS